MNGFSISTQTVLVISCVLVPVVVSELVLLFWLLLTSHVDFLVPVRESGELFKVKKLSFLVRSEIDSVPDRMRLS